MNHVKHIGTLYIVIVLLLSTIVIMQCSGRKKSDDVIDIVIPEVIGTLTDSLPKEDKIDTTYFYKFKDTIIKYYNPVDTVYIKEYIKAPDNRRAEMYADAVAKRTYTNTVEDSIIAIEYKAETQGRLKSIDLNYKIKERTYTIPKQPVEKFSLYLGGGLETTTTLDKLELNPKIGMQFNDKGLFYAQYGVDTKSIQFGYVHKLISIKK